jgi:N-acetyl-anhydromuramyl-L-alanine amidase AmpD
VHVRRFPLWLAAPAAALLAACGDMPPVTGPKCDASPALSAAPAPSTSPYDPLFARAGAEFGVPAELLRAVSYVETRWQMVRGEEEFPGRPAAFGLMALRGEALRRGAEGAGVSVEAARTDPAANVRAAAALLRSYADALGIDRAELGAWAPAVARYSGIESPGGRESYVRGEVYRVLGSAAGPSFSRSAETDPCARKPPANPADHAAAVWRPSPNFNERMAGEGGKVHMVIIHTCEGSYTGCWSWLTNPASQVSAHYVVNEDGTEVSQLVREAQRAWHIGATYADTLNGGHDRHLTGVQSNHFTIGVEHGGYASQASWPVAQIDASAKLVCEVTRRWSIPRDRFHIVGHAQLQPYNRSDPGKSWPWAEYLARIQQHCGG